MTETQTPATTQSPEFRLAQGALERLRQDLFHGAFAYRPLPPLRSTGPVIRRLPGRIRGWAVWSQHVLIGTAALIVLCVGYAEDGLPLCVPAAAPVLLTLVRPVGAWWLSLLASAVIGFAGPTDGAWPWTGATATAHVVVLTVVAARTRPRTAGWMWVLTVVFGLFIQVFLGRGNGGGAMPAILFLSALTLLTVTVLHIRRNARKEVAAQRDVTAVERGRRTLLEERTTIARELHDVVAHHMSVVAIQAEAAPYRVENPPPELAQAFVTIRENAVTALTELRRVLGVVRAEDYQAPEAPQPTLADLGGLIGNVREAGLSVERTVTGAVRELPPGVELSAYRIIQEALSNVLRHAPGSTATVEIGYVLRGLGLRVVNSPPRGPVKPSPGAGHGVTGMRERVAMLDGEMTAGAAADGGYEVAVFLPVPSDAANHDGGTSA